AHLLPQLFDHAPLVVLTLLHRTFRVVRERQTILCGDGEGCLWVRESEHGNPAVTLESEKSLLVLGCFSIVRSMVRDERPRGKSPMTEIRRRKSSATFRSEEHTS